MSSTGRRWLLCASGLAVASVSVLLCGQLAHAEDWVGLGRELSESVRPRPGAWRLLRGALHFIAIPTFFVVAAASGYAVWRRDRRSVLSFAAVLAVTNLVVQAVKHVSGLAPEGLNPLSGHVGLAAGLGCAWLLSQATDTPRGPRAALPGAFLLIAGTGAAILLTGWHTLPQILAPIGIGLGCALVVRAAGPGRAAAWARRRTGWALVISGLLAGNVLAWVVPIVASGDGDQVVTGLVALLAAVAAATSVVVGLLTLARGLEARVPHVGSCQQGELR